MAWRNKRQRANVHKARTRVYGILRSDWPINMSVTSARVSDYVIDITTSRGRMKTNKPAATHRFVVCVYALTCEMVVSNERKYAESHV